MGSTLNMNGYLEDAAPYWGQGDSQSCPGLSEKTNLMPVEPLATVVITTKNRREELREAIQSALAQTVPVEILVVDDGSTDCTAEMLQNEFPSVRVERSQTSHGYIVQRNRAIRLATGNIIFSIDDDAIFTSPHIVAQTLAEFSDPRVGAVAIPYTEPRKSSTVFQKAPSDKNIYITDDYIGTSHALRKDLFLQIGGYREFLFHQGEEKDLCIRMLEAGYVVRLGGADLIHHMESPKRDYRRMDYYGCRNAILFAWLNVPWLVLPIHLAATTLKCLLWSLEPCRLWVRLKGLIAGYRSFFEFTRKPVSLTTYRKFRRLARLPQLLDQGVE